jgi:hypothetical protein
LKSIKSFKIFYKKKFRNLSKKNHSNSEIKYFYQNSTTK